MLLTLPATSGAARAPAITRCRRPQQQRRAAGRRTPGRERRTRARRHPRGPSDRGLPGRRPLRTPQRGGAVRTRHRARHAPHRHEPARRCSCARDRRVAGADVQPRWLRRARPPQLTRGRPQPQLPAQVDPAAGFGSPATRASGRRESSCGSSTGWTRTWSSRSTSRCTAWTQPRQEAGVPAPAELATAAALGADRLRRRVRRHDDAVVQRTPPRVRGHRRAVRRPVAPLPGGPRSSRAAASARSAALGLNDPGTSAGACRGTPAPPPRGHRSPRSAPSSSPRAPSTPRGRASLRTPARA